MTGVGEEGTVAVLVHGLWHGAWAWDEVRERLTAAGVSSTAVELSMTDLAADAAEVRAVLEGLTAPVVLVGHSYGGAVITAAGDHPRVRHLVYLAGFPLAEGESVGRTLPELNIPGTRLGEAFRYSDDRSRVSLDPVLAGELLYADVSEPVALAAVARLVPVGLAVFGGVPTSIAWRHLPSTYVVSADDLVVHPDLQRAMATRAGRSLEWRGGHSQPVAHAQEVADLVAAVVRAAGD